jgi:nicotinamide mononucleotide transporter
MKAAAAILFAVAAAGLAAGRAAGWVPFSWLETAGAVTGAACVLLVVWRSVWNFPVGIVNSAAYLVCFAERRLYADAGLRVAFHPSAGWPGRRRRRPGHPDWPSERPGE